MIPIHLFYPNISYYLNLKIQFLIKILKFYLVYRYHVLHDAHFLNFFFLEYPVLQLVNLSTLLYFLNCFVFILVYLFEFNISSKYLNILISIRLTLIKYYVNFLYLKIQI